jgi:hypothetical protein
MERSGESSRRHGVLNKRKVSEGLITVDHEPHADRAKLAGLSVCGSEHTGRR